MRGPLPVLVWWSVTLGVCSISVAAAGDPAVTQETVDHGRELYRIYCQACHGETGRGDGPVADELPEKPADLTRLGSASDGTFPREAVYEAIDGRRDVASHRARGMPIWGLAFQQLDTDIDQQAQVDARIRQLVAYLESIQPGGPSKGPSPSP